jgi:hypothetical protein
MKPKAFVCERTAEYLLVPRLVSMLSAVVPNVVPFYFWSSREGSPVSRDCDSGVGVRLVSVFARRPKIMRGARDRIVMKINRELLEAANVAVRSGIPMFAGVPLVSSIFGFTLGARCGWFELTESDDAPSDAEIVIRLDGAVLERSRGTEAVIGPLRDEEVIDRIQQGARTMTWTEGIEHLRAIRPSRSTDGGFFAALGTYRPFYLMLLPEHWTSSVT